MDRYMRQKGYGVHAVGYFKVRFSWNQMVGDDNDRRGPALVVRHLVTLRFEIWLKVWKAEISETTLTASSQAGQEYGHGDGQEGDGGVCLDDGEVDADSKISSNHSICIFWCWPPLVFHSPPPERVDFLTFHLEVMMIVGAFVILSKQGLRNQMLWQQILGDQTDEH